MHDYFHTNKLYFEGQYGFRKKHFTELAAVEMIDRIIQELDKGHVYSSDIWQQQRTTSAHGTSCLTQSGANYGTSVVAECNV